MSHDEGDTGRSEAAADTAETVQPTADAAETVQPTADAAETVQPTADEATSGWLADVPVPALLVAGLVAGILLWVVLPLGPTTGTVAVVPVEGGIDGEAAVEYGVALQRARADPSVDAVVLLVNSPGGGAAPSESMYLETLHAAEEMPVVASVDSMAASGGYYAILGSDHVYAKPSSLVGSVGVLFVPPTPLEPTDEIIATGPSKLSGADQRGWYYKTEALQEAFLSAVMRNRGDNLTISRQRVATAQLFTGARAVETGLADEIGGTRAAIAKAADLAGLDRYSVRVIRPADSVRFVTRATYLASNASEKRMASPTYFLGPPASRFPNFLMLPPDVVRSAIVRADRQAVVPVAAGANATADGSASEPTARPTGGGG